MILFSRGLVFLIIDEYITFTLRYSKRAVGFIRRFSWPLPVSVPTFTAGIEVCSLEGFVTGSFLYY